MTHTYPPTSTVRPHIQPDAAPLSPLAIARSHAVAVSALNLLMMPAMLFFAVRMLSSAALWAAPAYLLVPEVLLIGLTMTFAVMALLSVPVLARQLRSGQLRGESRAAAERWLILARVGAGMQIVWAMGVSAFTCGG